MILRKIDWPWKDFISRVCDPPPMEPTAPTRLRMQQTFHTAMIYRGKKDVENEERELIMEHYDMLGPEMRWDFVKSYHAADFKGDWRRFVIEYGEIPENILSRGEFRERLDGLREAVEYDRKAAVEKAAEKVAREAFEAAEKIRRKAENARREAAEAIEKEREAEEQRQKQLVLKREWDQMKEEDDMAWYIREKENDAIKEAHKKARISARAKANRDLINAQRNANREEIRKRERGW